MSSCSGSILLRTAACYTTDVERFRNRVQTTTDGHKAYLEAVDAAFAGDVDYAMLVKLYGNAENGESAHWRYSPGECNDTERTVVTDAPNLNLISTSYAERQNASSFASSTSRRITWIA